MYVLTTENFKEAKITLILITLNVVIFFTINLIADTEYFYLFAQINYNILYQFEFWRLFTAMFLHSDILHIFSNMIGLLLFGAFLERSLNKFYFLLLYLLSGLIGNVFSLFLLPLYAISLGASGAIFGLIGASFVIIATEKDKSLLFLGLIYLLYFIISSFAPGINFFAHIFGLIGGIIFGLIFFRKRKISVTTY